MQGAVEHEQLPPAVRLGRVHEGRIELEQARQRAQEAQRTSGKVYMMMETVVYSREYLFVKELYDKGGELALKEISRRKPIPKNRVEPAIEQAVIEMAIENPAFGQVRVANELTKRGQFVSPTGVRSVWVRNDLQTFARRLKALEARLAQNAGMVLTEQQVRAMEKAKQEKEAHGEIDTAHPGYLGAQDTYYVGTIKSIGRIYGQTFIDTYSKVAFVKLYDRKNALVAADWALLSAEAQYFALQGVEQALQVIELARDGLNPDLQWLGVLFNIADMRTVHSRDAYDSLREHVGDKLLDTVVRQSIAYAESAERAVSILEHRPDLGEDYVRLADEVLGRLGMTAARKELGARRHRAA